jgi:FkbM family methyltransferase
LEKSVKANNFDIKVIPKALHEKTGKLYFHSNGPWGIVMTEKNKHISEVYDEIDCISLDDWAEAENIKNINLIKLDIEGSEPAALRGGKEFLKNNNCPPIFCEINSWTLGLYGETQFSLYSIIKNLGYKAYEYKNKKLYEFDIEEPPFVVIRDLIFINDTSKINVEIIKLETKDKSKIIERIIKQLSYNKYWKQNIYYQMEEIKTADYVCLALKDFPEYYKNPEIFKLLQEISRGADKYPFLEQCVGWFK